MTSQRKLKKRAEAQGMTGLELRLLELVGEILGDMRWMQILAYSNQYLLNQKMDVSQEERDQVLEAATRAVDKDSKLHEWSARLDRLKSELVNIRRRVDGAREDIEHGVPAPEAPLPVSRDSPASEAPREDRAEAAES